MFYLVFAALFAAPDLFGTAGPWVPGHNMADDARYGNHTTEVVELVWITQPKSCRADGTIYGPARIKVKTDSQEYKDYLHRLKFPQTINCGGFQVKV